MVEDGDFIYCSRSGYYYTFDEEIIQIEDMDDDGLIEFMMDRFDIILDKDHEEVLRKLAPEPFGIGSPTNHEKFQEGVKLADYVSRLFYSEFISQTVIDGYASSLGLLTKYEKGITYTEEFLEHLLNLYEQKPPEEAPTAPTIAYDLIVQHLEDLAREGKQPPPILWSFAADVYADTRRDKAEKKRPRPKHPNEKPGRKRNCYIRDKALDIAVLALVREGWLEVGNEDKIPLKKQEEKEKKLENPKQRYEDDAWANSAIFGVAIATGMSFSAVKKATAKYRRQRGSKTQ